MSSSIPFHLFSETRSFTERRAAIFTRLDEYQSLEILLSLLSRTGVTDVWHLVLGAGD